MAWIKVVDEAEARGPLAEVYQNITVRRGKLSNIMMVHSLDPAAMRAHLEFYLAVMFGRTGLSREEREMLAVVVSSANRCDYCVNHHAEALRHFWRDEARLARLCEDFRTAGLGGRLAAIAAYGDKLTRTPDRMEEDDVRKLREAGLSDEEILSVNLVCAYFNFVNRVALGLGVAFTAEEVRGYRFGEGSR